MATIKTTPTAQAYLETWVDAWDLRLMDKADLDAIYDNSLKQIIEAEKIGDVESSHRATWNFNSVARENLRRYLLEKEGVEA